MTPALWKRKSRWVTFPNLEKIWRSEYLEQDVRMVKRKEGMASVLID